MRFCKENLRLYAVTDRQYIGDLSLAQAVEQSLQGGVTMLQLREKNLAPEEFFAEAKEIQNLCRKFKAPFIINDDAETARRLNADGAHIGQEDMTAQRARQILGEDKILGVSAQTVAQAKAAEAAGADYLGVGAMFPTSTKPDADAVSPETLRQICAAVQIPVVAIGGITRENVSMLANSGIAGIAVVSAIFAAADIKSAAAELHGIMDQIMGISKIAKGAAI